MRPQAARAQDSLNAAAADPHARLSVQRSEERAVGQDWAPRSSGGRSQASCARRQRDRREPARPACVVEPLRLWSFLPARSPLAYDTIANAELTPDHRWSEGLRQHQDHPRAKNYGVRRQMTTHYTLQLTPMRRTDSNKPRKVLGATKKGLAQSSTLNLTNGPAGYRAGRAHARLVNDALGLVATAVRSGEALYIHITTAVRA